VLFCIKDVTTCSCANSLPLQVYAPWCGHCQALEPEYNKLGEALKNISSIVIAKMDGTKNEHERLNVGSALHLAVASQSQLLMWIVKSTSLLDVFSSEILFDLTCVICGQLVCRLKDTLLFYSIQQETRARSQ